MLFKIYVSQEFIKFLPFHKLLLDPFCSSVTEGTKDHLCKLKSEEVTSYKSTLTNFS